MSHSRLRLRGLFCLLYRHPDGTAWRERLPNGVTTAGCNYAGEVMFRASSKSALWYVGAIDGSGFVAVDPSDTHSSHAGWSEFAGVLSAARPAWNPAAANSGRIASASSTVIQVTGAGSVRGLFLANSAAVGAASGPLLYCTAVAPSARSVSAGGSLTVTYTVTAVAQ